MVKRQDADDDIYIAQAQLEFDVAQKLNHPAIVAVYDTGEAETPGQRPMPDASRVASMSAGIGSRRTASNLCLRSRRSQRSNAGGSSRMISSFPLRFVSMS